jgi:hypothetical protein
MIKSKLTPKLLAHIRKQLARRAYIESWSKVARVHRISRRNLMAHVQRVRDGS